MTPSRTRSRTTWNPKAALILQFLWWKNSVGKTGPSEAGRLGRLGRPHFSWLNFVIIARVHRSLVPCDDWGVCVAGRESVLVVNINHVLPPGIWIAGLCEFSSTFAVLSDRDVFVSSNCQSRRLVTWRTSPLASSFRSGILWRCQVLSDRFSGSGRSSVAWPQLTELEIDGCK